MCFFIHFPPRIAEKTVVLMKGEPAPPESSDLSDQASKVHSSLPPHPLYPADGLDKREVNLLVSYLEETLTVLKSAEAIIVGFAGNYLSC